MRKKSYPKLPRTIPILGRVYHISYNNDLEAYGMCNFISDQAEEMIVESFANLNYALHGGSFKNVGKR